MHKFSDFSDPHLKQLPPSHRSAVEHALDHLHAIYGSNPDPEDHGFVAYVESGDTPVSVSSALGRDLSLALEGVFRDGDCLVGVVLWGNSGAGVTLASPREKEHAPQVAAILRSHLCGEGRP